MTRLDAVVTVGGPPRSGTRSVCVLPTRNATRYVKSSATMTDHELHQFTIERKRLFGVALRADVELNIAAQAKPLDFGRAMKALAIYRKQLPYRGFYTPAFNEVYNRQAVGVTASAEATAAPRGNDDPVGDKRRERIDFDRVTPATRAAIDARYPDIAALPRRAYEMCIVLAAAGCSIEQYRTNDPYVWQQADTHAQLVANDQLRRERLHTALIAKYREHHRQTGEKVDFDVEI